MALPADTKDLIRRSAFFATSLIGVVSGVAQLAVPRVNIARWILSAVFFVCLLYAVVQVWQRRYVARIQQLEADLKAEREQQKVDAARFAKQSADDAAQSLRQLTDERARFEKQSAEEQARFEAELAGQAAHYNDELVAATGKLTLAEEGHRRYLEAIERISDRERPLFEETLEVTVWVGTDDSTDRVVEKRITTPRNVVTQRTMRPIVPTGQDRIVRLVDLGFQVQRDGGRVTALPLREQQPGTRVWLVFEPALNACTNWEVEYRPTGLWRPLRERGWDTLIWDDRLPTTDDSPSAFTDFKVIFKFPPSDQPPSVKERWGYGLLADPAADVRGWWEVVWQDERPAGRRYVWDLTHSPVDEGVPPAGRKDAL